MADVSVYSTNPGLAVLLSKGAQFNVIQRAILATKFATGEAVLGLVGAVVNDRGVPGAAVELAGGMADLGTLWGGFSPYLGDGAASGYEGNLYARARGIDAPRLVLVPVDLAAKTATIASGTDLRLSFTRSDAANGAKTIKAGTRIANRAAAATITGAIEADDNVLTASAAHGLAVGDIVTFSVLTSGAGLSLATPYFVVSVPAPTTFTVSATAGGAAVDVTTDYSAFTAAAQQVVVALLEDVAYTTTETGSKTVRFRPISGTPQPIATLRHFLDASPDTNITLSTSATTVPDDLDAAELLLRYTAAVDAILNSAAGRAITVIAADRDEAGLGDVLDAHALAATSRGYWRVAVVSPPVGTSAATAVGTSGDGVGRTTLDGSRTVYAYPGVVRPFLEDSASLTSPDYLCTVPSAIAIAARMANTPVAENPARPHRVLRSYGIVGIETLATPPVPVTLWAAGICQPEIAREGGQLAASFRDGVTAAGTQIADVRISDFLAAGLVDVLSPYHKAPATPANREAAGDAADAFLALQQAEGRIAGYAVAVDWDATNDHLTVQAVVDKTGNLNVITINLAVGGNAVAESGAEEA